MSDSNNGIKVINQLLVPIRVERIANNVIDPSATIRVSPNDDKRFDNTKTVKVGDKLQVLFDTTGALIGQISVTSTDDIKVTSTMIPTPQGVPNPTFNGATPSYLVGQGKDSRGNVVTRELWWSLTDQSLALAPNQSEQWSVTYQEGVEQSSTVLTQVSSEFKTSSSLGWGPIAAEVSASLSASSSTEQSITLNDSKTENETLSISNPSLSQTLNYRLWQMVERYTVWDFGKNKPILTEFTNDTNALFPLSQSGGAS